MDPVGLADEAIEGGWNGGWSAGDAGGRARAADKGRIASLQACALCLASELMLVYLMPLHFVFSSVHSF